MVFETETAQRFDWEVKRGYDGKGQPIFALYVHDSLRYPGSVSISFGFGSEAEAVANANCMTNCGNRVY